MESRERQTMSRTANPPPETTSKTKITKDFVAGLKATGARQVYRDTLARGLLLRVNADGSKAWYFDYRDPAGKRQSYKIGDAERIDPGAARLKLKDLGDDPAAERRAAKVDAAKAEARADAAASRTINAFLDKETGLYWLRHLKSARSGEATRSRVLASWAPLLETDMAALDVQDAIDHRAERLDDEVSPQTLNRDRIALMALLNQAHTWGVIDRNPLDVPSFKPLKTEDDKRVRYLGMRDEHEDVRNAAGTKLSERARFMAALADAQTPDYLRDIATVAMNTGLRRGELFKLRWSMVSLQNATITVAAATAKSAKTRHVPLNATALAVLERLSKVKHISGFVFVNKDTALPFTTLKKSWAVLIERAQLVDMTFHDLRHDFASRLVQAGVDLYQVRDLLGHSSITLTERYAHLAPHQKRAAVALLEAAA